MPPRRNDQYLRWERAIDRYAGAPLIQALALLKHSDPRREAIEASEIRRILAIKLHGIGNVVLLLPLIRRLKKHFQGAEIDFLTLWTNKGLFEAVDEIRKTHYVDASAVHHLVSSTVRVLPCLRKRSYDLVIDFEQFAYFSALLSLLACRGTRVGFLNPAHLRHLAYTIPVTYSETEHMAGIFERLVRAVGAEGPQGSGRITLRRSHEDEALAFLDASGIRSGDAVVVLHPGSSPNLTLRRWPPERFARLGDRLAEQLGMKIVVSGGREEEELVRSVIDYMTAPAVNGAGQLSLLGFAALCGHCELLVGNDTGPIQIATSMGTPAVGLYGPNTPFLYGPLGPDSISVYNQTTCSPCLRNVNRKISRCTHARCLEAIGVDQVFSQIKNKYFDWDGDLIIRFKKQRISGTYEDAQNDTKIMATASQP
ncbi:MAG: glycosyltransferase family 9 protein [Deltaproteobacteria bacterium]|nr:glycosyltransferase family 9 protein [Deltaproteobacteria bacterium]